MKLINLNVIVDEEVRRSIKFHDGLNLVTNRKNVGRSGNSVGKSTLSRVVDFLFLGAVESIYIDEEFDKPNHEIESLFKNSEVYAELTFDGVDGKKHSISRKFAIDGSEDEFAFDGNAVERNEYESNVQKYCFNVVTRRPSVRALVPKFIRNNSHRMLTTTRFLDSWAGDKDYSEIFLYLFGFDDTELLTAKRDANNALKRRKRNLRSLNSMVKEQKPKAEVEKIQKDVAELERKLFLFDYSPKYDEPVKLLTDFQKREDELTGVLLSVDRKINNINKTVKLFEEKQEQYLEKEVFSIYKYAGVVVDKLARDYKEVLAFHKNLVEKKKEFISSDIGVLERNKYEIEEQIKLIQGSKLDVISDMRSSETVEEITKKLKELGSLKELLGKVEGLLEQQKKASTDLNKAEAKLDSLLGEISRNLYDVALFEEKLNDYFKRITKIIHDDTYEFSLNLDKESIYCRPEVASNVSNPEGGKKKAEVISFDFAYIHAVKEIGKLRPRFVFHDSIEDIDQAQIKDIFELSKTVPGQQIVSMLSDKLSDDMYKKYLDDVILMLDENDMFFRV